MFRFAPQRSDDVDQRSLANVAHASESSWRQGAAQGLGNQARRFRKANSTVTRRFHNTNQTHPSPTRHFAMAIARKDAEEYERVIMITGGAGFMCVYPVSLCWLWLSRFEGLLCC
jgi:hypothetical protein